MDFNPDTLLECLERDFERSKSTCHVTHYRIHALRQSILKKFSDGTNDATFHSEAMADFAARNEASKDFALSSSFINGSIFRTWKTLLFDVLHSEPYQTSSLTLGRCLDFGRCGPGKSLGSDTTSFLEKMFASPLTCTDQSLLMFYKQTIRGTRWAEAEEIRSTLYPTQIVSGSRLSSVRKDRTKNRTICIEPTLNMFYQLGAKHQIEAVLKSRFKIDISTQADVNKMLAKRASVDNSLITVDLKNASDSVLLVLCHALLPKDILETLLKIRSSSVEIEGELVQLNMISTMGNGFTFALMSLIFAALIKAISIHADVPCVAGTDWGVFGDDLIVRSELKDTLLWCLSQSGFEVNTSKSFFTGPFRESCGGDYYNGHDVRGVYIKEVENYGQVYSAFNRLHFWAIRSGVSLNDCLVYLKGLVNFQPVPGHSATHEGFIVTAAQLTSPKRDRNGATYYRSFGYVNRGIGVGRFLTNYQGCVIAFLGGYVSGSRVLCRSNRKVPEVVKRKTPCWDFLTHPGITCRELDLSWQVLLST